MAVPVLTKMKVVYMFGPDICICWVSLSCHACLFGMPGKVLVLAAKAVMYDS